MLSCHADPSLLNHYLSTTRQTSQDSSPVVPYHYPFQQGNVYPNSYFGPYQGQAYQRPMTTVQGNYDFGPSTTLQEAYGMHAVATDPTLYCATCPPGTAPPALFSQSPYGQYTPPTTTPSRAAAQGASGVQHAAGPAKRAFTSPVHSSSTSTSQPKPAGSTSAATNIAQFPCRWSHRGSCPGWLEGEKNSVARHLRDHHGFINDAEIISCAWDKCGTALQRRNVARHIVACHLEVKVYSRFCNMPLPRTGAGRKHEKNCTTQAQPF